MSPGIKFKRWLWKQVPHRAYVWVGTSRCYRCGCHYNSWHKGGEYGKDEL